MRASRKRRNLLRRLGRELAQLDRQQGEQLRLSAADLARRAQLVGQVSRLRKEAPCSATP